METSRGIEGEVEKDLLKSVLHKTDMMIKLLESEIIEIRDREEQIVIDLEVLYKKKEDLLTLLSGIDFKASLLDQDWDKNGTLRVENRPKEKKGVKQKKSKIKRSKRRSIRFFPS